MSLRVAWKVKPFFKDERGEMSHLLKDKQKINGALLITCKKGSIRANHYHKKDTHYSYVLKGSMEYVYKDLSNKDSKKKSVIVKEGEIVETPPMVMHAMKFLEDSIFIALTTEERDRGRYEKDTVRIQLIS
ncbi:MAG: cupin domain-containing protein [Candidatus Levybacteria bacterium]|nr:cupin domain-containing protein [Candidatus Levybacteria bacterium]